MRNLAAFIMRGRVQAVFVVTAFTVLSWFLPLATFMASAAVALPALRLGAFEGGIIALTSAGLAGAAGSILAGDPLLGAGYSLTLTLPTCLGAMVLRETGRLRGAVLALTGLATLVILVLYAAVPEPASMWIDAFRKFIGPALEAGTPDAEALGRLLQNFARFLTGAVIAGSTVTVIASLLLGRWWQAALYNPGGFKAEFVSLSMPAAPAYAALILMGIAATGGGEMAEVAGNLAFAGMVPFLFTGLSVVHGLLGNMQASQFWVIGTYVLLVMVPYALGPVLLLGLTDGWADWRGRLGRAPD